MLLEEGMNVKVTLLPDGDDPDSFARKHNATDYQNYINSHEVDFIRFKTDLLLSEAGDDPIKRAGLINDIVRSISVIPEPIVRSVYIKECSQTLQVEEQLLIAEVNKLKEIQAEKAFKIRTQEQQHETAASSATTPSIQADGTPAAAPAVGAVPVADHYESYIPQEDKESRTFYPIEKLIMGIMVRYGEKVMCNVEDEDGQEHPLTVIEYIVSDLQTDDLQFHNPLHRRMLSEAMEHLHDPGFRAEHYFSTNPDPVISQYAADLMNDRYTLSKYHSKSQKIVSDEERLLDIVPHLMIDFKHAIVEEELKLTLRALQDPAIANDTERCLAVMKHYKELSQIQNMMAKRLGDRVLNI